MSAISLLDMAYDVVAGPIPQFAALVYGDAATQSAALPSGENSPNFLGFSQIQVGPTPPCAIGLQKVMVRRLGVSPAIAAGPINYGDRVIIASAAGDVMSVEAEIEAGTNPLLFIVGRAENSADSGQTLWVFIEPQVVPAG